jgi:inhibitor of KinA
MNNMSSLEPLGDQAVLLHFTSEDQAAQFASAVRGRGEPWLIDVVQAYQSVAVFFDPSLTRFTALADVLEKIDVSATDEEGGLAATTTHRIPCCYELELDLSRVAEFTGQSRESVVRLHTETSYTIYAIGFCPGFPYLGYLPAELQGVPRLDSPRLRVEPGSIGMTGKQTGIYTEPRPGGWNIIGRTPLELVNVREGYFPLRTGDRVEFEAIGQEEYQRLLGKRLQAIIP